MNLTILVNTLYMPSLFIDTLSSPAFIALFDKESRNIIDSISWEGKHAEFDTLIESINILLSRNALEYSNLQGIACLIWPWGFTGIRVTTLIANTLGYSYWIPLYPITVEDFFQLQGASLPWILSLTKTEVILWEKYNTMPRIIKHTSLDASLMYTTNQISFLTDNIHYIQANNYQLFLKNFSFPQKTQLLYPLYARDPNILIKK